MLDGYHRIYIHSMPSQYDADCEEVESFRQKQVHPIYFPSKRAL